jgi:peptidoglycan hydrolase CwlO-like protein
MSIGKPVSRSEALERSTQILIDAESSRLNFASAEAKIGVDYNIDISSSDIEKLKQSIFSLQKNNEELKNIIKNLNNQITQLSNHYL